MLADMLEGQIRNHQLNKKLVYVNIKCHHGVVVKDSTFGPCEIVCILPRFHDIVPQNWSYIFFFFFFYDHS